jgi:hypothetical protein
MLYAKMFFARQPRMALPFGIAVFDKQVNIYIFRTPRDVSPTANTQHFRRQIRQSSVLSLPWGFSSNGVSSVTVQGE